MQPFIRFLCLELVLKIKEARKLNWAARAVQETLAGSCSSVEIRLQADGDAACGATRLPTEDYIQEKKNDFQRYCVMFASFLITD